MNGEGDPVRREPPADCFSNTVMTPPVLTERYLEETIRLLTQPVKLTPEGWRTL